MDNFIPFNINDAVLVRLTDHGRAILLSEQAKGNAYAGCYVEDAEGRSKWQLWVLMGIFGVHLYNGCKLPFKADIRLETRMGQ